MEMDEINLLISVIVPIYQVEPYLRQCVDSILAQTYTNLEVILVDDGSPDGCPAICDAYAAQDSRVRVIHKPNGGLSDARNAGMEVATGDCWTFVDSDDWIDPTMYAEMVQMLVEKELDIVQCSVREVINGKKSEARYSYYPTGTVLPAKEIQRRVLRNEIAAAVWFRLYRRRCIENIRFPVGRTYEDIAVVFLPFENAVRPVGFIDKPFYNYRINENGIVCQRKPIARYHLFLSFCDCYHFAAEKKLDSVGAALGNAVRFAMGTYLDFYVNGWQELKPCTAEAEAFLAAHRTEILQDREMPRSVRLSARLYYTSPGCFKALYRLLKPLRKN